MPPLGPFPRHVSPMHGTHWPGNDGGSAWAGRRVPPTFRMVSIGSTRLNINSKSAGDVCCRCESERATRGWGGGDVQASIRSDG